MIHLGVNFGKEVSNSFNGWLGTIRNEVEPSELVVSSSLRDALANYLRAREWEGDV